MTRKTQPAPTIQYQISGRRKSDMSVWTGPWQDTRPTRIEITELMRRSDDVITRCREVTYGEPRVMDWEELA